MFVNLEQIKIGLNNFIDQEIAKKAVGLNKFLTYLAMPVIDKNVDFYMESFSKNAVTKYMFDENGNVDIDAVYNMAKDAIRKSGQIVVYNIMFNESDIDRLYSYIKQTVI